MDGWMDGWMDGGREGKEFKWMRLALVEQSLFGV
jgi:hypothetical protein